MQQSAQRSLLLANRTLLPGRLPCVRHQQVLSQSFAASATEGFPSSAAAPHQLNLWTQPLSVTEGPCRGPSSNSRVSGQQQQAVCSGTWGQPSWGRSHATSCTRAAGGQQRTGMWLHQGPQWSTGQWDAAARRGYAATKHYSPSQAVRESVGHQMLRSFVDSPGMLAEPYTGTPVKPPLLRSWLTPAGWKARWDRLLGGAKSMYTISRCRKLIKPWSMIDFKAHALKLYVDVCRRQAAGDRTALRQLVTSPVYGTMKKEIRAREDGGWRRVEWDLPQLPTLRQLEVVHGRLVYLNPKDDQSAFAQLTVSIPSEQRFAAYDAGRKLVAGSPEELIAVRDLWVFERALKPGPGSRWRVAGRLDSTLV